MRNLKSQNSQTAKTSSFHADVLCGLLLDAYKNLNLYSYADHLRDLATLRRRIDNEGQSFLTKTLPELAASLLQFLEFGNAPFTGFKTRENVPVFLRGIFGAIIKETIDKRSNEYAQHVKYAYAISSLFKKLEGPYKSDALKAQWNDFVETDVQVGQVFEALINDQDAFSILESARHYAAEFADGIDIDEASEVPRPGPGACATPVERHMRYQPHTVYRQHDRLLPYTEFFYSQLIGADVIAETYPRTCVDEPQAKYLFVPKTAQKARGICAEENESQFLQQWLARVLRKQIHVKFDTYEECIDTYSYNRTRLPGHCVLPLENQRQNATLARTSSRSRFYATIDMSEASDRISRDLVSWLFQDNVSLHNALMALSTKYIVPPKEACSSNPLRTNKYAPMGSGLCFPIMSLVHYFLCKAIIKHFHKRSPEDIDSFISVYGDDIVVPSMYAETIYRELPKFGMKLNVTKSYYRSHFRESCGTHAYNGVIVTPVYVRRTLRKDRIGTQVSAVATEYLLLTSGFAYAARALRKHLAKCGIWQRVPHESGLIGIQRKSYARKLGVSASSFDVKRHSERRWNAEYQCFEYKVPRAVKPITGDTVPSGHAALLRWFGLNTENTHTVPTAKGNLGCHWCWVPESHITEDHCTT
jgi:hypothetical protein